MERQPIWRLVQDCARELTKSGNAPFTRANLISCVQKSNPNCEDNSINPIIQGLTDNLKGGAPVPNGRVLYSVGRGLFVLYSKKQQYSAKENSPSRSENAITEPSVGAGSRRTAYPETENELRDVILDILREKLKHKNGISLSPEGRLTYSLPSGTLSHASDILARNEESDKYVSIELKYKSAVTDQFKCRAYDAIHMKDHYQKSLLTIMLFIKTKSGVSIEQAERISYPFDVFIGIPVSNIWQPEAFDKLTSVVSEFLG